MTLYTKWGSAPDVLPTSDHRLSDGWLLTPLDGHPEAIAACGWVEAPKPPAIDDETEQLGWDGAAWTIEPVDEDTLAARRSVRAQLIDDERDRRIVAGFRFAERLFQSRPEDQKRIAGAFSLALAAVIGGAQPGNLLWHQPADGRRFAFIAADNSEMPMDAQTVLAFGRVAASWESAHIFAARALKNAEMIPADFVDDAHWPR